jgi:hypothetical protein
MIKTPAFNVLFLLENPGMLREFDVSLIPNEQERTVVDIMTNMLREGVQPTYDILLNELQKVSPSIANWLREGAESYKVGTEPSLHLWELKENFNTSRLFNVIQHIQTGIKDSLPSREIQKQALFLLNQLKGETVSVTAKTAAIQTMERLRMIYAGEIPPRWITDKPELDAMVNFGPRQSVLIASQQKVGKSRMVYEIAMALYHNNPALQLKINSYNFEQPSVEMVISLVAHHLRLSTNVINGQDRMPSYDEQQEIARATAMVEEMRIRFVNHKMTMSQLSADMRRHSDDTTINIVDNWGLVIPEDGRTENQHDDHMAAEFVDIRDQTDSLIFLLHHLSKTSATRWNKMQLFEPEVTDVRGSNRLSDYVNTLLMPHRYEMYPVLRNEGILTDEQWAMAHKFILLKMPFSRGSSIPAGELYLRHNLEYCRTRITHDRIRDFTPKGMDLSKLAPSGAAPSSQDDFSGLTQLIMPGL